MPRQSTILLTPRDLEILAALGRTPLTARQLLKLSQAFAVPFTSERKVRARLYRLYQSGRVRRWPLAIAGRGVPNYYTLARRGYALLNDDGPPPSKRAFSPVGIARQQHAFQLAEFIVHTAVVAHRAGLTITDFSKENQLCLGVGDQQLWPDAGFVLRTPTRQDLRFYIEVDNHTERIRSTKNVESWERKLRLYEALQERTPERFRVLVLTKRGAERVHHILELARALARVPERRLVYGIPLAAYLAEPRALTVPCFLDHDSRPVALVQPPRGRCEPSAAPSCSEPSAAVASSVWYAEAPAAAALPSVR